MKAEDTLLSRDELEALPNGDTEHSRVAQAKKTWKLAFNDGWAERGKWLSPNETERLEKARLSGIREVVKWVMEQL